MNIYSLIAEQQLRVKLVRAEWMAISVQRRKGNATEFQDDLAYAAYEGAERRLLSLYDSIEA